MSNPAAIRADFCNIKNVMGRKVIQIVCEIPVERANEVYQTLGWPDAHSPKAVAIALLNEDAQ
jgi:hypothetical protein